MSLQDHLASGTTTVARAWRIERRDGVVLVDVPWGHYAPRPEGLMSDRPSGNPNFEAHGRGLPVVAAPVGDAGIEGREPHPADEAHLGRVRENPPPTGWSPTAWRKNREDK